MTSVNIGEALGRGYQTWKHNLILCIPFIIGALIAFAVAMAILLPVMFVLFLPFIQQALVNTTTVPSQELWNQIVNTIIQNLWVFTGAIITIAVADGLIMSFFTAGAIGMAKEAILTGHTNLQHMISYGKKKFISYFGASILIGFISLIGIVFLIPGILTLIENTNLITAQTTTSLQLFNIALPLLYGIILFVIYALLLSIVFFLVLYAVVLDDLSAFEGFRRGIQVFRQQKANTFILWLIIIAGAILLGLIGRIPFIGGILVLVISFLVYTPMITLWISTFYLSATATTNEIKTDVTTQS
jgi:hypothetical protein